MKISYKWLCDYLPEKIDPEKLSYILTAVGLEVESLSSYEEIPGSLQGLLIGEVLETEKHPNADKLTLTKVNIGKDQPLQIVCGAPNVMVGQKVVVAPVGVTIHPTNTEPITMKNAKIRGMESQGMICAEDEIGLGDNHDGIIVLNEDVAVGAPAAEYYKPYTDHVFEIGLTPNRMDAMSHLGVARDVCAYMSLHEKKNIRPVAPKVAKVNPIKEKLNISVTIENPEACRRYSGIAISNTHVTDSPTWMQQRLRAIGLRPINNIVDITNYILHESGQPLHAFDADKISGKKVIVKNLAADTPFVTLDEKERKLSSEDLMICDTEGSMCIGGVFGGIHSGVTEKTTHIFLESAWFDPATIRKTSFRHGLRTDAASRFEKGTDISNTVNVLVRAAQLIEEITGGNISSDVVDEFPKPLEKKEVILKYHYLKKLSGKNYSSETVKKILESLGFEIVRTGDDEIRVLAPYFKPDVELPADIVEEILRIDGLDNIDIPKHISISPATEGDNTDLFTREKVSEYLVGAGFREMLTNSISNSAYYSDEELSATVKMINNLSSELDVLRPSIVESGLASIVYNLNRKNNDLKFFEFGKTYQMKETGNYEEPWHLALFTTGNFADISWRSKGQSTDFYQLKGLLDNILKMVGVKDCQETESNSSKIEYGLTFSKNNKDVARIGKISNALLNKFDIKQPVWMLDINWDQLIEESKSASISYVEISKFQLVSRDLAIILDSAISYGQVKLTLENLKIQRLQKIRLFDIFESEKLGAGKKSIAINFTFLDKEKTLTDQETDAMMQKIIKTLETTFNAEIRK